MVVRFDSVIRWWRNFWWKVTFPFSKQPAKPIYRSLAGLLLSVDRSKGNGNVQDDTGCGESNGLHDSAWLNEILKAKEKKSETIYQCLFFFFAFHRCVSV